jgi:hypothetical protein
VSEPRRCSEQDWFPFTYMTTAYLAVRSDGAVFWPGTTEERRDAVRLVMAGVAMLYAVWPGQRRSDVFVVADPGEVAEAFELGHHGGSEAWESETGRQWSEVGARS